MKQFYGKGLSHIDPALLRGKLIVIEGADGSGRSTLIGRELEEAKKGNILSPITFSLFYATDFCDQLENIIIPALRADFLVLADRYIYTLMVRDMVRGMDAEWVREVYSIALVPDAVFYLKVPAEELAERNFRKNGVLEYWESGMDIRRSGDMYECFIRYQRQVQKLFHAMQEIYGFEIINGNRSPQAISAQLQGKIERILLPHPGRTKRGGGMP